MTEGPQTEPARPPWKVRLPARTLVLLPLILGIVGLLGGLVLVQVRPPQSTARIVLQIQPLSVDSKLGSAHLGILIDWGTPQRSVQTALALLSGDPTVEQTAEELGWSEAKARSDIMVEPLGDANIIAVTARAGSAEQARHAAETYARVALQAYNAPIQRAAREQLAGLGAGGDPDLHQDLQAVADQGDPGITEIQAAASSSDPAPIGLLYPAAGAAAGVLAGFALSLLFDLRRGSGRGTPV